MMTVTINLLLKTGKLIINATFLSRSFKRSANFNKSCFWLVLIIAIVCFDLWSIISETCYRSIQLK